VLGVDPGARRLGIAVSDAGCTIASGLETLKVRGAADAAEKVAEVARRRGVRRIVVGLPLNMNGSEGEGARLARRFAEVLSERCACEVVLWDERLTSAQARGELARLGRTPSREKGEVDRVAATLLLQSYLDSLK